MKKAAPYIIALVIVIIGISIYLVLGQPNYGIVQGTVVTQGSGDPVRALHIVVDDRSSILYHSRDFELTHIPPGSYTLKASAPYYEDFTQELKIKKGKNPLDFVMVGKEIPDLSGIIVFTESYDKILNNLTSLREVAPDVRDKDNLDRIIKQIEGKNGIILEVRLTDSEDIGITDFPYLPVTLKGTLWVRIGEEDDYVKGEKIFEGPIEVFWDPTAYLAKYKGLIPWNKLAKIDKQIEKYGVLELTLHTSQGDFQDTVNDVRLFEEKK